MSKKKLYFENEDSTTCYPEDYFRSIMESNGDNEIAVLAAVPGKASDFFWCKYLGESGYSSSDQCGVNNCNDYSPRNGRSGCCRFYTKDVYCYGDVVVFD